MEGNCENPAEELKTSINRVISALGGFVTFDGVAQD